LVIEYKPGKENLLPKGRLRKYKYFHDATEKLDFTIQTIDSTEDNREPKDTAITTNNLSISPVSEDCRMEFLAYINLKYADCDYNKYICCY